MSKIPGLNLRNVILCIALLFQVLTFLKHTGVSLLEGPTVRPRVQADTSLGAATGARAPSSSSSGVALASVTASSSPAGSPAFKGGVPNGFGGGAGAAKSPAFGNGSGAKPGLGEPAPALAPENPGSGGSSPTSAGSSGSSGSSGSGGSSESDGGDQGISAGGGGGATGGDGGGLETANHEPPEELPAIEQAGGGVTGHGEVVVTISTGEGCEPGTTVDLATSE